MTVLTDFHDLLMPELPGCPAAMVNLQLIQTAREFCQTTSAWVLPLETVNVIAGTAAYSLFLSDPTAELTRITSMSFAGQLLWVRDEMYLNQASVFTYPAYRRNEPPFTLSDDLLNITLTAYELAGSTGALTLLGACKPVRTTPDLPDLLMSQYSDAIRYGTLSRLMIMGKKPWTDRELAAKYMNDWKSEVNYAAYQVQVGNTNAPLRVQMVGSKKPVYAAPVPPVLVPSPTPIPAPIPAPIPTPRWSPLPLLRP